VGGGGAIETDCRGPGFAAFMLQKGERVRDKTKGHDLKNKGQNNIFVQPTKGRRRR